jgi:TonB family protein
MPARIGSLLFSAVALVVLSGSALAQSNLTAKASVFPAPAPSAVETDRIRDGLVGPVRRVRTEVAKLSTESGKQMEGRHAVLEIVAYDVKGNKIENQYFPVAGANLTGKEVYKYDEKGNISEMTLVNDDGSLLSKEIYRYEFDFAGNWNKMTTSVAVIEGGKLAFEPSEVTYRFIMYYLDENMMKLAQPASQPSGQPPTPAPAPSNSVAVASLDKSATSPDKKPAAATALKSNANSSQKTAPSLPPSALSADKLNNAGLVSTSTPQLEANSTSATVQVDSEPPPPPLTPRPILKPVSGGVLNGTAINLPSPIYPEGAKRLRVQGLVTVEVVVDETGKVISAVATSGPLQLRDVAMQAAMRARFSPTKLSGQPVKVSGVINYKFALTN